MAAVGTVVRRCGGRKRRKERKKERKKGKKNQNEDNNNGINCGITKTHNTDTIEI
jgi:hypothetical protein